MSDTYAFQKLSAAAALRILEAGMAKAQEMGIPQCITVVDEGGNLLAFVRMDGARFNSIDSSRHKAITAASSGRPSGLSKPEDAVFLAVTTQGRNVNLKGGIPIIVDGRCIGGIGVGSGTGDQDREVALAALRAIKDAKKDFDFGPR
jgi:uncharacterized protein GlcG (DUF336 family)